MKPHPLQPLPQLPDFHDALEEMVRALLLDYSLEQRSRIIKASLRRGVRNRFFH
jgi:hypothetical protein